MAHSLFDDEDKQDIVERIRTLDPSSNRLWGKMTLEQMLRHVTDPLKSAMGEYPVAFRGNRFFTSALGKYLFISLLPWPKGKTPTAPEFNQLLLPEPPPAFTAGVAELLTTIDRFHKLPPAFTFERHAAFGPLTRKQWGNVMGKHLDHHLRQFGA
jgi:hypothetical protein